MKNKHTTKSKRLIKKQSAFKDNVKMLIDATKKAFTKKTELSETADCFVKDAQTAKKTVKTSNDAQIAFFYTNDKYFIQSDDNEIIKTIKSKYPTFMTDKQSDAELKSVIVMMLQDKEFIQAILEFYSLSIQDFFKFMFRLDTAIFKGPFLAKLQKIVYAYEYNA